MGDLKTNWTDPVLPNHDTAGQGVVSSGSDPNAQGGDGPQGLTGSPWNAPPLGSMGIEEAGNSVSGLPAQPNRFEPSDGPPDMPSLQDRMPGTIDKQ
jgi:hypothetical protein